MSKSFPPLPSKNTFSKSSNPSNNSRTILLIAWHKVALFILWLLVGLLLLLIPNRAEKVIIDPPPKPESSPTPTPVVEPTPSSPLPPEIPADGVYCTRVDINGESGNFCIYMFSKKYVWETGSWTEVENLGNLKNNWKTSFSPELKNLILKSKEIVVVGTADVRNKNVDRERARANDRTRTLSDVAEEIRRNEHTIYRWNLGQWTGSTNVELTDQRRIFFIEIQERSPKLDITKGVRQVLEKFKSAQPIFGQILSDYSDSSDSVIN